MPTKKQMCKNIIYQYGLEHPYTIRFCQLMEWGFTRSELYTAYMAVINEN